MMIKKTFFCICLAISSFLLAQQPTQSLSATRYLQMGEQEPVKTKDQLAAAKQAQLMGRSEMMIISPEMRAKDFKNAFEYLKQTNTAAKIAVKLKSGSSIKDILGMDVMPGGTMIIFKTGTIQGIKYHVVNIESIESLGNV